MEKAGYKKDLDVTTIEKSTLSQRKKGKQTNILHKLELFVTSFWSDGSKKVNDDDQ